MRLGVNIEYEGRNYDVLELPEDAFLHLVHGLSTEQFATIDDKFHDYWPEDSRRRRHILEFSAEQLGISVDYLLLNHEHIRFSEGDLLAYIEHHMKQGDRPS